MMLLSFDSLAAMQAAAEKDTDYARLFNVQYVELDEESAVERSCLNLPLERYSAIETLYERLLADQPNDFRNTSHLFAVLKPLQRKLPQPPANLSDQVMMALKIELGYLDTSGLSTLHLYSALLDGAL